MIKRLSVFISALYQALCRQLPSANASGSYRCLGLIYGQYENGRVITSNLYFISSDIYRLRWLKERHSAVK